MDVCRNRVRYNICRNFDICLNSIRYIELRYFDIYIRYDIRYGFIERDRSVTMSSAECTEVELVDYYFPYYKK